MFLSLVTFLVQTFENETNLLKRIIILKLNETLFILKERKIEGTRNAK